MPLFMIITIVDTTIQHLMYMQEAPFQYTERDCVCFFAVLKFTLEKMT